MMKELFEELQELAKQGEESVVVTILASSGSTPRGAGARMLVRRDGSIRGTVGGGAVEYQAIETALKALENKVSHTREFTLTKNQAADIGMVCGGDVTLYFQYAGPEHEGLKEFWGLAAQALGKDQDCWLLLDITDENCWGMGLYSPGEGIVRAVGAAVIQGDLKEKGLFTGRPLQRSIGERKLYVEPLVRAGTVYIFGGGHVAQELVPALVHVGFRCVVMDDREEFANKRVFPQAAETIAGNLERIGDYIRIRHCDYVCVMTRGHQFDYYVQRHALSLKPCYIGVMGSRNKIRVVTEKLMEDGFSREEIEACHMPIGTRIHARTPAEIAISIAGELIAVRAKMMSGT